MSVKGFKLTYKSDGRQLLTNDSKQILFEGKSIFKFFSFWQSYEVYKKEELLIDVIFKCISNRYFSIEVKNQFLKEEVKLTNCKTLISLTIDNTEIKLIPKEFIINREFLIIVVNNVKVGSIFREVLKFGTDIYNIEVYEKIEILDYILITCMINLNNYR